MQHEIIGYTGSGAPFERTDHPDARWFFEPTRLGLFIHVGISTVHGDCDISWGMMDNPDRRAKGNGILTPREYWRQAETFDPKRFEPERWLSAAKEAGFTYAVFTTRRHALDEKSYGRQGYRRRIRRRVPQGRIEGRALLFAARLVFQP